MINYENKVIWLIEKNMFDYEKKLREAILKNGDLCILYDYDDRTIYDQDHLTEIYREVCIKANTTDALNVPVIAHGSIKFIKMINKSKLMPGAYANFDKFKCSYYYPLINQEHLLNGEYFMMPFGSIEAYPIAQFFNLTPKFSGIFIRPDDGSKSFTGRVTYAKTLESELESIKNIDNVYHNEMCLISKASDIVDEFRFVVVDGKVITGSKYKEYDELDVEPLNSDDILYEYAQNFADDIKFSERAYTLDLCYVVEAVYYDRLKKVCKIVELNSFSSADFYAGDLDKLIPAISNLSISEWEEYN